jgi:hypothetical protein
MFLALELDGGDWSAAQNIISSELLSVVKNHTITRSGWTKTERL